MFSVFFLIDCCISVFFYFLIKTSVNLKKLIQFHRQVFIVYKNGENLKILIEIFCQEIIVSNVIFAFLEHLKPKIFFVGQPRFPTQSTFSESLDLPLPLLALTQIYLQQPHIVLKWFLKYVETTTYEPQTTIRRLQTITDDYSRATDLSQTTNDKLCRRQLRMGYRWLQTNKNKFQLRPPKFLS